MLVFYPQIHFKRKMCFTKGFIYLLSRMETIKPYKIIVSKSDKPYPFQKYIDEQKHLDTDELRHLIQPIIHVINQDFKGEEHKYCDKIQLCPLGKYKRPKVVVEAEARGFTTFTEMFEADKKAEEDKKAKLIADQKAEVDDLKKQLSALASSFQQYIQAVHPPK